MLLTKRLFTPSSNNIRNYQVTILGAASEVGQTVSLLLRAQPSITKLVIHDAAERTSGVVLDLSHVPTDSSIKGFSGYDTLERALKNSDVVIATGGATRKPGLSKKYWLSINTDFIKTVSAKIAKVSPMPLVGIVTEPINCLVPMAAEIMRNHGNYDFKKLFGVTAVDVLRAQSLYATENNMHARDCFVPVIGGHSEKTMVPLISQSKPSSEMNERLIQEFTAKIRKGEGDVIRAKKGWSPTLSVAYGVLIFTRGILEALDGRLSKVNAFIENKDFGTSYFSGLVSVNKDGAGEMERYNYLSQYECHLLERSIEQLRKDVMKGKKILELA